MWARLGLLLILTISVVALPSVTHSEEGSPQTTPTGANHFMLVPMNFEYGDIKWSTVVRLDTQTGKTWALRGLRPKQQAGQTTPPDPVWQWFVLPE